MWTTKHMAMGTLTVCVIVALAVMLFIWPNYREAKTVRAQVADLRARASTLLAREKAVERLAGDVHTAREHIVSDLKVIPETADVAGLIRKLSDAIDGVNVLDQTFTAGTPSAALAGASAGGAHAMATPVAADMRATFDSVFALLRKAESMDRLVRVASVRLLCKRDDQKGAKTSDVPVLAASVSLEVVFEPLDSQEAK